MQATFLLKSYIKWIKSILIYDLKFQRTMPYLCLMVALTGNILIVVISSESVIHT